MHSLKLPNETRQEAKLFIKGIPQTMSEREIMLGDDDDDEEVEKI